MGRLGYLATACCLLKYTWAVPFEMPLYLVYNHPASADCWRTAHLAARLILVRYVHGMLHTKRDRPYRLRPITWGGEPVTMTRKP